jgi:membrane protein DedA with SNARE-associated domain
MEDLILRFGLVAVFLVATVEGDLILVLAGVTAHLGLLPLWPAIAMSAGGCLTGDLAWYGIGRSRSDAIRRTRAYSRVGPAVERVAGRLGSWQILTARFMYGTRVATMLFWGVHRLPLQRFVSVDAVGCLAWAAVLGLVGYGASSGAAALVGEVKRAEIWLLVSLGVSIVALLAGRWVVQRRKT